MNFINIPSHFITTVNMTVAAEKNRQTGETKVKPWRVSAELCMPRDVAREPGRCGPKQLIKVDIFSLECGEKRERERLTALPVTLLS